MNKLFILSGASGAGKSTLLNRLVKEKCCNAATKYTNRQKYNTVDDVSPVQRISEPNLQCDLTYSMYGNIYGFSSIELAACLQTGNTILITNDSHTIEKIKDLFPNRVVVIYIISDINKTLLRQIYMQRHGYPSLKSITPQIDSQLTKGKEELLNGNSEAFIVSLNAINKIIDDFMLNEKEFKLRLDSILYQESLLASKKLKFDYVVLNLYSHNTLTVHATESAFLQLKKIITVETR